LQQRVINKKKILVHKSSEFKKFPTLQSNGLCNKSYVKAWRGH